jgi:hypothetical protein
LDCAGRHAEQQGFYKELYGRMQEPDVVLHALVQHKEEFAKAACRLAVTEALDI